MYAGRVPCFLKRNIKKVDKENRRYTRPIKRKKSSACKSLCLFRNRKAKKFTKEFYFRFIRHKNSKRPASGWIDNDRVKRLCLEPQDSEGMPGGRIGKGPAKTVKHLANGKLDNERLCRNPQKEAVEKTDKHNRHNDYPNSFSIQKDSDSVFECDSNTEEVSPQTEETLTDVLNDREESSHERYVLKSGYYVIQSNQSRTINQESLSSDFKESQRICKPTSSELSDKENEFFPKGWFPKHFESKNSRSKTRLSFNKSGGTINQDYNESQSIFKATSNREDNSEACKINMVRKYPSENSRQVRSPTSNKEKCTRELRVSLMDCFANLLHTRQNLSRGSFQTTSTPRAIRVPTKSQEVPTFPITPRVPTLHMTPRVLTSHTIPKVPTSAITPRVPTSHITAKVPKLHITPRMPTSTITPPESEVSCTEDESSVFTQKEEFEKDKFRGSSKENNEKATEGIVYKPLFSNKPRLWKSVVVENDS